MLAPVYQRRGPNDLTRPYDARMDGNVFLWILGTTQAMRAVLNPESPPPKLDFRRQLRK